MDHADICIIGSGFGGAISAARLSEYTKANRPGTTIRVIEKGHDYWSFDPDTTWKYRNAQGNGFKQTNELGYATRLLNLASGPPRSAEGIAPAFALVGGKGIGGGSLVYFGVSLRAPSSTFDQTDDNGARLWPTQYSRKVLDSYYARVEKELKVCKMEWSTSAGVPPWQLCTKRDYVFAQGCLAIGATAEPNRIATQNDANEGWWLSGQRFPGRQSLNFNYLNQAKTNGVHFDSDCDVTSIEPSGANGYVVSYRDNRSGTAGTDRQLECKVLIVSGGTIGSTGLLMKSRDNFAGSRALSDHLGFHVSSNGDYFAAGVVGKDHAVESHKGKPMSSACFNFFEQDKFVLMPFDLSPLSFAFGQPAAFAYAKEPAATGRSSTVPANPRMWGPEYKEIMKTFGSRLMTMFVMGWDRCEGKLGIQNVLGQKQIVADWQTTHPETERMWSQAVKTLRKIFRALDGDLLLDQYRHTGGVATAHPLGGCRMAASKADGVVSPFGEVWDNRNLFVLDGSIVPTSIGVNPSLTISAVTELALEKLISELPARLG